MLRRRGLRRGFTLLEAAIALTALTALSATGYVGAQQARVEFEHNQNRLVVQNLASATTTDAAVRGQQFNPDLLEQYAGQGRFAVGGVDTIAQDRAATSSAPGDVVAWTSDDLRILSIAMASTRDRCLQTVTAAGQVATVLSVRTTPCRPILPEGANLPGDTAPPAPAGVTAVPGNGQVTLGWAPSFDEAAYLAVVSPTGRTCSTLSTSCVIVLPAGAYSATVIASNRSGTSPPSTPVSFTVTASPAAPQNLVALAGAGQAQLSWTLPDDNGAALESHLVQYHTGSDWIDLVVGVEPSAVVPALTPGVEYAFRVAGVNVWGAGPFSTPATAVIFDTPQPPGLSVSGGFESLTVTLSAPESVLWPVEGYAVAYRVPNGTWVEQVRASADTFTISGLQSGTSYEVRARTLTGIGPSAWTEATASTTAPAAPTIGLVTPGTLSLSVSFTAPAPAPGSTIVTYQYSTDGGTTWRTRAAGTTASPLAITTRSVDNEPLVAATAYQVRIRAVDAAGPGAPSNQVSATPYAAPAAPNVTATAGAYTVSLAWAAPAANGAAITGYRVEYKSSSSGTWLLVNDNVVGTSWPVSGLAPRVSYDFRVAARNAAGLGDWSVVRSATPWTDSLYAGNSLVAGSANEIKSRNGWFHAVMQGDGNFVVYDLRAGRTGAYWDSATQCAVSCSAWQLRLSGAGLLQVVDASGAVVETINPHAGQAGGSTSVLVMQDDGNLTIYTSSSYETFTWSLYTSEEVANRLP
jgi:hypothetical protein